MESKTRQSASPTAPRLIDVPVAEIEVEADLLGYSPSCVGGSNKNAVLSCCQRRPWFLGCYRAPDSLLDSPCTSLLSFQFIQESIHCDLVYTW